MYLCIYLCFLLHLMNFPVYPHAYVYFTCVWVRPHVCLCACLFITLTFSFSYRCDATYCSKIDLNLHLSLSCSSFHNELFTFILFKILMFPLLHLIFFCFHRCQYVSHTIVTIVLVKSKFSEQSISCLQLFNKYYGTDSLLSALVTMMI